MTEDFYVQGQGTTDFELIVVDISGGDLNKLSKANGMAKTLQDDFRSKVASVTVEALKIRAFVNLPENVCLALKSGDAQPVHNWVESSDALSHLRVSFEHSISIDSTPDGNITLALNEDRGSVIAPMTSIKLKELQDILFWRTHEIGDTIDSLTGSWIGFVTRAEEDVEALKEFNIPVVRTSYSKVKKIPVMAKNLTEARVLALEEADGLSFKENYAEYDLATEN